MAVHEFDNFTDALEALDEGRVGVHDHFIYLVPHDGEGTGSDQYIICNPNGRAIASCGWQDDAVRIAQALDNA